MRSSRQQVGRRGEDLAAGVLQRRGYTILQRNVRLTGVGEIDILAQEGDTLVVVEVRTRRGGPPFSPEDSVGPRKQTTLARLAEAIAYDREWNGPLRVDLVAIELRRDNSVRRLSVIRDIIGR